MVRSTKKLEENASGVLVLSTSKEENLLDELRF